LTSPGLEAAPSGTDFWGTTAAQMQSGVTVSGNNITGTLKYISSGQIVTDWGEGHFLGIKFTADDWSDYTSVKVGLSPSQGSGLVELLTDDEKIGMFKITSGTQRLEVVATDGTNTNTQFYDLTGLVLEGAGT